MNYAQKGDFFQLGLVNVNGNAYNQDNGEREVKYILPFVNWNW